MESVRLINQKLVERYGKADDGRPVFRLVWSDSQHETRIEDMRNGIYLPYKIAMDLPKYSYLSERWVLEKLVYHPCPEIPESFNGHYEPVYVFQDRNGNYLSPYFWACEAAIDSVNTPKEKESENAMRTREEKENEKKVEKNLQIIQNESPYLATMLHNKEAIVVPDLSTTKES